MIRSAWQDAFQSQKRCFCVQTTAVAGQRAPGSDHPVARDQDGNRVGTCRSAHRSRGSGSSDAPGDFPVGRRRSVRDVSDLSPYFLLEGRAPYIERQIKPVPDA